MSRQGSIHRDTPIFEYFGMCNVLDENSIFVTFSLMQVFSDWIFVVILAKSQTSLKWGRNVGNIHHGLDLGVLPKIG